MREAKSWMDVIHPAAHIGAEGELERQIKRIQADSLREAAEIADRTEFIYDSQAGADLRMRNKIRNAILAKAKEL